MIWMSCDVVAIRTSFAFAWFVEIVVVVGAARASVTPTGGSSVRL